MKYVVQSTHRQSGIESERVVIEARSARRAVTKFAQGFGSLGMLNYVKCVGVTYERTYFEVMGTSGMLLDVTVGAEAQA